MTYRDDAPVLPAYLFHGESVGRPADYFVVWCEFCRRIHRHTAGEGHRHAHCAGHGTSSPYNATGYILMEAGTVSSPDELISADEHVRRVQEYIERGRKRSRR